MAATDEKPCWINDKLPSPIAVEYTAKGTWEHIGGLKTYISGSHTSKKAVVVIYDAFGVCSQVLQGTDRLADHMGAVVIMPDFFKGFTMDHDEFEKDPTGYLAKTQEARSKVADVQTNVKVLLDLVPVFQTRFPTVDAWAAFGLCWGGKVAVLASIAEKTPFKASGQTHPGRLSAEDAKALTIPHICMPSKDEPAAVVDEYEKILNEKKLGRVERFPTMFHGWMGARANLTNEENRREYEKGYAMAAEFFAQHL